MERGRIGFVEASGQDRAPDILVFMSYLFVGNWKMNPGSGKEAQKLWKEVVSRTKKTKSTIVMCPSFPHIALVKPSKKILLGAQNASKEIEGAYTGQASLSMLKDLRVSYVIVGHSEVRALGETDEVVSKKVRAVLKKGMTPIVCVGETLRDSQGVFFTTLKNQIENSLFGVTKEQIKKVVIAYEPLWAIGTGGIPATPHDVHEVAIFIRKVIGDLYGRTLGDSVRMLYGGSVDKDNARAFLDEGMAQGLLVGRASLNGKTFSALIDACSKK